MTKYLRRSQHHCRCCGGG